MADHFTPSCNITLRYDRRWLMHVCAVLFWLKFRKLATFLARRYLVKVELVWKKPGENNGEAK
jgi:hypothetical protein